MRYEWQTIDVAPRELVEALNTLEKEKWEVFQIIRREGVTVTYVHDTDSYTIVYRRQR